MKMTLDTTKKNAFFPAKSNMLDDLIQQELIETTGVFMHKRRDFFKGHNRDTMFIKSNLSWDLMLHSNANSLSDVQAIQNLKAQGVEFEGLAEADAVYRPMKKRHDRLSLTLEEFKETPAFQRAVDMVTDVHGEHLFPYQIECAALIVSRKRLLNAMDMGLGKTRTTVAGLTADPKNKKILIVTMSRNIHDWEKEFHVLGFGNDYIILNKPSDMKSKKRIHLVSYESWARETNRIADKYKDMTEIDCPNCERSFEAASHFCKCGFSILKWRKKPLYKYFNRSYKAAAIDEGHLIKNGNTSRNRSILAIKTPVRVLLSGTPAESGASDLFWPLTWIAGDSYHYWNKVEATRFEATNYGERCFRYTYGGFSKTTVMDSDRINSYSSNLKDLWKLQDKYLFRKMKTDEDVKGAIHVPKPEHRRIHIEQTEDEQKFYKSVLNDFSNWYREVKEARKIAEFKGETSPNRSIEINVWLEKLRRAASSPWVMDGYVKTSSELPSKLQFVREHMSQEAKGKRKMLIFTAHKQTCEELGGLLDSLIPGYSVGYIHGSVPMEKRKELMKRFQDENDELSVLIMTMRTGAESFTLTEAKSVILWDLDYNAKKIQQCYSRAVRLGQLDVVKVIWLINVDTIDANMHSLILSKTSSVDLAIDRKELDFEEVAKEFEGQGIAGSGGMDIEAFANEMLSRGTSRNDYESA